MKPPRISLVLSAALAAALLAGCSLPTFRTPERTETDVLPTEAAPFPTEASTPPATETSAPSSTPAAPPARHHFSKAALDYFSEIALGAEYGDSSSAVRKWTSDVKIAIHGDPTAEDRAALDAVIADLNALIGTIQISIVRSSQNVDLYFAPESEFSSIAPEYIPTNMGFFWTWSNADLSITNSRILISTTDVTPTERAHLIREELTQSLGLMNDSYAYEDSMFYQGWTSPTRFSALDQDLVTMLYLPELTPGMSGTDALAVLRAA